MNVTIEQPIKFYERKFGRTIAEGWLETGESISVPDRADERAIDRMVGEPVGYTMVTTEQGATYIRRADAVRLLGSGR